MVCGFSLKHLLYFPQSQRRQASPDRLDNVAAHTTNNKKKKGVSNIGEMGIRQIYASLTGIFDDFLFLSLWDRTSIRPLHLFLRRLTFFKFLSPTQSSAARTGMPRTNPVNCTAQLTRHTTNIARIVFLMNSHSGRLKP